MSLSEPDVHLSFFDASYQADHLFEAGSPYRLFREKILPLLEKARPALEGMYCATNGRPPIPPVVMAGVLLWQYIENVPDRMAAEQVRLHLGWKYALKLKVNDAGFNACALTRFRDRLHAHAQARLVFDAILGGLEEAGLVRDDRPTRLDSTHVLGVVAHLSRLDKMRETLRLTLKEIAGQNAQAGWAGWEALWGRYGHRAGLRRTVRDRRGADGGAPDGAGAGGAQSARPRDAVVGQGPAEEDRVDRVQGAGGGNRQR
jgi:transposase